MESERPDLGGQSGGGMFGLYRGVMEFAPHAVVFSKRIEPLRPQDLVRHGRLAHQPVVLPDVIHRGDQPVKHRLVVAAGARRGRAQRESATRIESMTAL